MVLVTLYRVCHDARQYFLYIVSVYADSSHLSDRTAVPQFQLQAVDYRLRLPKGWMVTLAPCDKSWVGRSLMVAEGNKTANLVNWLMPSQLQHSATHTVDSSSGNQFATNLGAGTFHRGRRRTLWRTTSTGGCYHSCSIPQRILSLYRLPHLPLDA